MPVGYGMFGWGSRGLVDIMLNNKDIADMSFASKLLEAIVINPTLDSKHSMMDDSSEKNLRNLERAAEDFISKQGTLWPELVSCLESKDSQNTNCLQARRDSVQFVEQYNFFDQEAQGKIPSSYSHSDLYSTVGETARSNTKDYMPIEESEKYDQNSAEYKALSDIWKTISRGADKRMEEYGEDDYVIDFSNIGTNRGLQILENETATERSEKIENESLALLLELCLVDEVN